MKIPARRDEHLVCQRMRSVLSHRPIIKLQSDSGRGLLTVAVTGFAMLLVCSAANSADEPLVANPDPTRFEKEINAFEAWDRKNSVGRDAVLFVGSSTIAIWPSAIDFPDLPVINRGFGGSHYSDVRHYCERIVLPYKPRVIVTYAGDNDIAGGKSAQQVFDDFRDFVRLVHDRLPKTKIIFISIKPSPTRWRFWQTMREANSLVERLATKDARLAYVDTAGQMLTADGQPRVELFLNDGLHLNIAGYQLWRQTLTPVMQNALRNE